VAVVLTLVQTKQIRIYIKETITKNTVQTIQNSVYTSKHINKTPTQLSKHPHIHPTTRYETSSNKSPRSSMSEAILLPSHALTVSKGTALLPFLLTVEGVFDQPWEGKSAVQTKLNLD